MPVCAESRQLLDKPQSSPPNGAAQRFRIFLGELGKRLLIPLCALVVLIFWASINAQERLAKTYANWQTESNLLLMPHGKHIPVLFFGTSRGRTFSRFQNHEVVEKILQTKILNLSKGGGGGILPALMSLEHFYDWGNKCDTIVYFLDTLVLFGPNWNEENFSTNPLFYKAEPFTVSYLLRTIKYGGIAGGYKYFETALKPRQKGVEPCYQAYEENEPKRKTPQYIEKQLQKKYFRLGLPDSYFRHYSERFKDFVRMARQHNARVIAIVPPTMFGGKDPGREKTVAFLREMEKCGELTYYDCSCSMGVDEEMFADSDHMSAKGIATFTRKFLLPILKGERVTKESTTAL
ncbi:MAG TPA: hypothetical protein V6D17_12390 [Candidatus Obscuribacterales bacterium]